MMYTWVRGGNQNEAVSLVPCLSYPCPPLPLVSSLSTIRGGSSEEKGVREGVQVKAFPLFSLHPFPSLLYYPYLQLGV